MNEKMTVNLRQPITCCKGCTDRHPACHADCERYLAEKQAYESLKHAKAEASAVERQHRVLAKRVKIAHVKKLQRENR